MATLYLASLLCTVISPHQREMLILSINGGQFPYGLLNRSFGGGFFALINIVSFYFNETALFRVWLNFKDFSYDLLH